MSNSKKFVCLQCIKCQLTSLLICRSAKGLTSGNLPISRIFRRLTDELFVPRYLILILFGASIYDVINSLNQALSRLSALGCPPPAEDFQSYHHFNVLLIGKVRVNGHSWQHNEQAFIQPLAIIAGSHYLMFSWWLTWATLACEPCILPAAAPRRTSRTPGLPGTPRRPPGWTRRARSRAARARRSCPGSWGSPAPGPGGSCSSGCCKCIRGIELPSGRS